MWQDGRLAEALRTEAREFSPSSAGRAPDIRTVMRQAWRRFHTMAFSRGDLVHIAAFGKGIVREVRNNGRYLVEVKGRSMLVEASQLTAVDPPKARRNEGLTAGVPERLARTRVSTSLDLHGMTVEEAVAALDTFLNDAILGECPDVQVIHGRSGGRLKAAVHRRLKQLPSVRGFRVDPVNPGVTIIQL